MANCKRKHPNVKSTGQKLFRAACNGKEAEVTRLLRKGCSLEWKNKDGFTPLSIAAYKGHEGVVRQLIAAGADIHYKGWYQFTPLVYAAWHGSVTIAHELIAAGADVNALIKHFTMHQKKEKPILCDSFWMLVLIQVSKQSTAKALEISPSEKDVPKSSGSSMMHLFVPPLRATPRACANY
ncbi:hypothetical protein ACHHYP_15435 [Achlya hypogyna]|uniref:Uncharacterized protein n=1 Tax=Achlya hypogyna TaxID=1202772 RepID=A0A1V9YAY3_ACHHY|nr:hypothetical protein ACHHYP_15435 [Achlya hypogyna]